MAGEAQLCCKSKTQVDERRNLFDFLVFEEQAIFGFSALQKIRTLVLDLLTDNPFFMQ